MARLRLIEDAIDGSQPDGRRDQLPDAEALDAYSRTVTAVAQRLRPSVANLRVGRRTRRGRAEGGGSAVVITPDGYMLTSAHVVEGSDGRAQAAFPDGRSFRAEVIGADPLSDLAVLRAEAGNLATAELGDVYPGGAKPIFFSKFLTKYHKCGSNSSRAWRSVSAT